MPSKFYLCEANGARILAFGVGISQLGDDYQMELETWDDIPVGEAGDAYFRGIDLTIEHTNGYDIGVTPIVDGVAHPEQRFTGAGTGTSVLQAAIAQRGARIRASARTIARRGDLSIENMQHQFVPLRVVP